MSRDTKERRSNTEFNPIEGEEKGCSVSYFGILIYEIQQLRKVKGVRALLNFFGSVIMCFIIGLIVSKDGVNSLVKEPEVQAKWLEMSDQDKLIVLSFLSIIMLILAQISKTMFSNALLRASRLPAKGQWNDENVKDALLIIFDAGVFLMQTYLLIQISWYFTYTAIYIVLLSAVLYRLFEKMSIHCDTIQLIEEKLKDREEIARIQRIIDEKGEYYDETFNVTIYKKEGDEMMKILKGEDK